MATGPRSFTTGKRAPPASTVSSGRSLSSQGLTPPFKQTLKPAPLLSVSSVCGNRIQYHLDDELLRPAGTTGNNPNASYSLSAKDSSTHADMSFTLGPCQVQQLVLQVH